MNEHWLTIAGMAVVTYASRAAFLVTGHGQFPLWLSRLMAYVPVALFAALALPAFVTTKGGVRVGPETIAGAVAALVAWRTGGKTIYVLFAGIGTFIVVRLVASYA